MKIMTGSYPMARPSSCPTVQLEALTGFALLLAFRSPIVTSLLEPWLSEPISSPTSSFEPLPVLCSKCGYRLGTVEGGWIKPGPCRHCSGREHIPFDAMVGMAYSLLGGAISQSALLEWLASNPIDPSINRVVERKQPVIYMQAPVTPTHKLINLDDGTIDAILNDL